MIATRIEWNKKDWARLIAQDLPLTRKLCAGNREVEWPVLRSSGEIRRWRRPFFGRCHGHRRGSSWPRLRRGGRGPRRGGCPRCTCPCKRRDWGPATTLFTTSIRFAWNSGDANSIKLPNKIKCSAFERHLKLSINFKFDRPLTTWTQDFLTPCSLNLYGLRSIALMMCPW